MIEEKKLKNFILKRFVIVLAFIGIAQAIGNVIFARLINPLLTSLLGVENIFDGAEIKDGVVIILELFIARFTNSNIAMPIMHTLERVLHIEATAQYGGLDGILMAMQNNNSNSVVYFILIICCFFVMLVIWLLPYVVGGVWFSLSVSKKVKELEEHRIEKNREIEKQKNLLLSDVAHDLKTPITTIAGFSQALAEGNVEEDKKQEYLDAIRSKSMQTVDMVTLLFEYVKLDSAGFELHKTIEDICELFRGCIAKWYADFEEKDMELDFEIPEEAIYLQVDKIQLERAFSNILTNAYKHNPNGTKLWISLEKQKNWISCKISDNGVWIESETAKHLFDPFVQGDKSRTTGKGSGLGLSITRKIVEMHEGRVRLLQYKNHDSLTKTFEVLLKYDHEDSKIISGTKG